MIVSRRAAPLLYLQCRDNLSNELLVIKMHFIKQNRNCDRPFILLFIVRVSYEGLVLCRFLSAILFIAKF